MTPNQLATIAQPLEKLFYETQQRIMTDVVRRIQKTGDITSTADYQLNKYLILGGTTEMIESEIQRLTQKSYAEMFELYDRVINSDYVRYKEIYEQINGNFPTIADPENEILNSWITGIVLQTHAAIKNISQSMGFTVDLGHDPVFTPLADVYQKYVDAACMDVVTGSFDYNTVLRRTARQMSRSGLQVVDYASGHVNRAPVAVRRAVMTGVNQVSAKINEKVAKDLNTDYFEVTAHSGARPSHMTWQGKVYSYSDLVSVCGLGDVTGLCGANCRHAYYAFIPEVSVRAYTDEELARMQQEDEKEIYWQGKPYNGYQRTQKARQYETAMRAQRSEIKTLKDGGADPADLEAAQIRYLSTMNEYKAFCADMSLRPQMNRVYIDGLGRMSGGRIPTVTKMPVQKTIKTATQKITQKTNNKKVAETDKADIIKDIKRIPQIPASTISKKVEAGEYGLKLSWQNYNKHAEGTKDFERYKASRIAKGLGPQSKLTISYDETQEVIKNKSGTGIIKVNKNGDPLNIEFISNDKVIGAYCQKGQYYETKKAAIYYSKRGAHLVPVKGAHYD